MDAATRCTLLEAQIRGLTQEKEAALDALGAAATLGHFDASYSRLGSPEPILRELDVRVRGLLPLTATAFYLVDETSQDMDAVLLSVQADGFDPEAEVEALIADHSFAFALGQAGPTFFSASTAAGRLLLHPLSTPSRVRGMMLCLMDAGKPPPSDTLLALLTVVINAGAMALESYSLYRHFEEVNKGLERQVAVRTTELRQAHDELRLIVDTLPAGVVVIDALEHEILDINPAGAALIGAERQDIVGRSCFDCFCPAQRGACPIVDGGKTISSVERVLRDPFGNQRPILKTAVRASLQGRDCIIESFVDITEQKKLAALREDVDRMTRHDLKGPLTGIIGLPDVLMGDPELGEEQRELVGYIKESGLKMLGMINLSLDLYKMETDSYVLDPRPVELTGVIRSVARDLDSRARAKRLVFRLETDGRAGLLGPVTVLGEELLYVSLFSNLLKNAVEASPEEAEVVVSLLLRDQVWAAIHNQGAVPEAIRERFFEKYATSGKPDGTGLGTYSARLIVENLGGRIDYLTDTVGGTTLLLSLPRP